MKNLVIDYRFKLTSRESWLYFPWGVERLNAYQPEIGWRTADPLSGEWELLDWERSSSGYGKLTFYYHPASAPDISLADIAARDSARLLAAHGNFEEKTHEAWMKLFDGGTYPSEPVVNTTVPAVVNIRNCCFGYGQTGTARRNGSGWSFWPDGEDRPYLFAEAELFFPVP